MHTKYRVKIHSGWFCPKCHVEKIKVELKEYPNHLLVCGKCQSVFKIVGDNLLNVIL